MQVDYSLFICRCLQLWVIQLRVFSNHQHLWISLLPQDQIWLLRQTQIKCVSHHLRLISIGSSCLHPLLPSIQAVNGVDRSVCPGCCHLSLSILSGWQTGHGRGACRHHMQPNCGWWHAATATYPWPHSWRKLGPKLATRLKVNKKVTHQNQGPTLVTFGFWILNISHWFAVYTYRN